MTLFTTEQYEELLSNGQPENQSKDHFPVVKLVLPGTNFKWLLTEIDPQETSIAFGLCDLAMGFPELGYVSLEEITLLDIPGYKTVLVDTTFTAKFPISVYAEAARIHSAIVESETLLKKYQSNTNTPT